MQLQQKLEREKERDDHAEDVLLLNLDRARGGFEGILSMPERAAAIAEHNIVWIGKLQSELKQKRQAKLDEAQSAADKLVREEKERQDAIARAARENQERIEHEKRDQQVKKEQEERTRLERATSQSQQGRIDLAQRSIKQVVSSLKSERDNKICLIFCLCMAPLATSYFNPKLGLAAACIAIPVAYYMHSRLPEMYAKIKWMEIYEQSLDLLKSNPHYTVRHAVSQQIERELAIDERHRPKIEVVLSKISEERVQGDPHEQRPTVPGPLQALVVHSQHPPRNFLAISLV
jgi:phage-related minor tail protein